MAQYNGVVIFRKEVRDSMQFLIQLSVSLLGGLLLSRAAKKLKLPAVTAYLIAGLLLGPF